MHHGRFFYGYGSNKSYVDGHINWAHEPAVKIHEPEMAAAGQRQSIGEEQRQDSIVYKGQLNGGKSPA